ncbi:MAG: zinc-dependent peptidase [Deltaproteobacteria bacterium]|nr:zinc-dependent peptidase [Deltaproteobacteria bacterium]
MFGLIDWWRRRSARGRAFDPAWRAILEAHVPFYPALTGPVRERFETALKVFLLTKHWIAAGGMVIDDEVKVVISAAAARLVMNRPRDHYQRLTEIVVYPSHYVHPGGDGIIFGEAQSWGTVVLSYDATTHGMKNPGDGHDTALHEFAHVLDAADGKFDGTPVLDHLTSYAPWTRVMSAEFLRLRKKVARRGVLRRYGATNEAEFFAVASEAFFEKPRQLRDRHPDLYAVLRDYYASDPASDV